MLAGLLSDIPADAESRCVPNLNSFSYLLVLLLYHPAVFFVIAFICQPVVLLVSLWGMTSNAAAGTSFLLSLPQQLAEILFETLKLPDVNQRVEDRIDSRR